MYACPVWGPIQAYSFPTLCEYAHSLGDWEWCASGGKTTGIQKWHPFMLQKRNFFFAWQANKAVKSSSKGSCNLINKAGRADGASILRKGCGERTSPMCKKSGGKIPSHFCIDFVFLSVIKEWVLIFQRHPILLSYWDTHCSWILRYVWKMKKWVVLKGEKCQILQTASGL